MSDSSSTVQVNVVASVSDLQAKMATAQASVAQFATSVDALSSKARTGAVDYQALINATTGVSTASRSAAQSAEVFRQALGDQTNEVKALRVAMAEEAGAEINNRAATEGMVVVHELLQGRLSRVGGSLMILTQALGGTSAAMLAMAGAAGVAALGVIHLVEWLGKLHDAELGAEAAAIGSSFSQGQADALVGRLRSVADAGTEAAGKIANEWLRLPGITQGVTEEMAADVRAFALRSGEDTEAAASKIAAAYNLDISAGHALLESVRASADAIRAWDTAAQDGHASAARSIMLQELARNTHEVTTQTQLSMEAQLQAAEVAAMASGGIGISGNETAVAEQIAGAEAAQRNAEAQQRLAAAMAQVSDAQKTAAGQPWEEQQRDAVQKLTLATEQAAHAQGQTWQQIHAAMAQTAVEAWTKILATTEAGTKNYQTAERELLAATEQRDMLQVRSETTSAKQGYEARVASYDQQIAAARGNLQQIEALEQQKLAFIKSVYGEESAQYQSALKSQTDAVAAAVQQQIREVEQAGKTRLENQEASLAQEAASGQITRQQELEQVQQLTQAERDAEVQQLNELIGTLQQGTAAYTAAINARRALIDRFGVDMARVNAQIEASSTRSAERMAQEYERAFGTITSAGERAVTGLVMGTTTWQRAELMVAQAVMSSFIGLTEQIASRWLAMELAKTLYTDQGVADRVATEQAAGSSGWSVLLTKWIGLEAQKTTATISGDAARTAADTTASATQNSLVITDLAKFVQAEIAKQGAAETTATVQIAAATTGSAGASAAHGAAASKTVMSDAAQAYSGAYASASQIPYVGWILGPIAGGAAFAAVAAYEALASFDVGTPYVPKDMPAMIHAGEMVIPATFSDAIRAGSLSLSGGAAGAAGGGEGSAAQGGSADGFAIHLNGPFVQAWDTKTGAQALQALIPTFAKQLGAYMTRNPSTRPTY